MKEKQVAGLSPMMGQCEQTTREVEVLARRQGIKMRELYGGS